MLFLLREARAAASGSEMMWIALVALVALVVAEEMEEEGQGGEERTERKAVVMRVLASSLHIAGTVTTKEKWDVDRVWRPRVEARWLRRDVR